MAKCNRDEYEDSEERSSAHADCRGLSQKKIRTSQPKSTCSQSVAGGRPYDSDGEGFVVHEEERESVNDTGSMPRAQSIPVTLSDPDVLDCPICFDPLTIPVFQCRNGHIACSTCRPKLGGKCPSCFLVIGNNRCRAIEKVIESIKLSCCHWKYGCKEKISYCDKLVHEEVCVYAPCSCPFLDCSFSGSTCRLSRHTIQKHSDSVIGFFYNIMFSVHVKPTDKFLVLQEWREGVLFILNTSYKLSVKCVERNALKGKFTYDVAIRKSSSSSSLRFQSITQTTTGQLDCSSVNDVDYLPVPAYFFNSDGCLKLDICICSQDASNSDIGIMNI